MANDAKFQIRLPTTLLKRLRMAAKRKGVSVAMLIRGVVAEATL